MKTTIIKSESVDLAPMLDGFSGVAASLNFLPKARIYSVKDDDAACDPVQRNGRELLGLT